jgi:hypothetical protein
MEGQWLEDFFKLLAVLILAFVSFLIVGAYRNVIGFYRSLGAKIIFSILPRAILSLGDRKFQISAWNREVITISTNLPINGYLSIERKLLGEGFDVFYDDEEWADRVLKHSKLLTLIEEKRVPNLSSFKIEGNTLKVEIYTRKIDSKTTEDVKKAIEFMLEVIPSLEGLPSSAIGVQKHRLRNWFLYYIPLGIFLLLSALGFYWREQGYSDALCEGELYILGFKILTPVFIAHFVLSVLILGKHFHLKAYLLPLFLRYLGPLFLGYLGGYYLVPLTILDPFNAKFDRSSPTRIETKIIDKYHLNRGGFRLELDYAKSCSLRVSESFYRRVDVGDTLVLYVKEGAFGVRWAYKYGVKGRM